MKKLAIIDYDMSTIGGVENVSASLANNLSNNYEVYLITLNNNNGKIPYEINSRVKYIELCKSNKKRIRQVMKNTKKPLKDVLKKCGIETAICMGTYTALISIINSIGTKTKIIFSDHGALINQWNERSTRYIRKFNSIFANHIVVLTEKNKEDYKKLFHVKDKKITQIYNFIEDSLFENVEEYKKESKKIITVGRFTDEKGFDMLIEIAKELKTLNDNWTWDVYGDGPEFNKIKGKIKEYNLEQYVFLKGKIKSAYDKYKEYSLYVLPSYREGLPLVLLEAKVNKLPIVSFDIETGPNEIVENNVNGFLIEKYNIKEMAEKIDLLLKNEKIRMNFSLNSYKNIDKFKKDNIIKQWINLIDRN